MKKLISIIMAVVLAMSVCSVMATAADSDVSLTDGKLILATGSEKGTAAKFAFGETVYGEISEDEIACYSIFAEEAENTKISLRSSEKVEITIENSDGTYSTTLTNNTSFDAPVILSDGYYFITIKNYVEAPADNEGEDEGEGTPEGTPEGAAADADTVTEFYFSVTRDEMPELFVNINKKEAELTSGESVQLELSDCTVDNLNYFWRVFDDPATKIDENEVASVTPDGLVTIKMTNPSFTSDTTIKVQAVIYYGNAELTKSCTIKAIPANIFLNPYFDTSDEYCLKLGVDAYRGIEATTNLADGTLKWENGDEAVATVSEAGKITATGIGTTTVKVTLYDKDGNKILSNSIKVVVSDNYTSVMGVTLDAHTASVRANESFALTYKFETLPDNGKAPSNSKVTFISSNPEIATVDVDGNVTGVAEGTATITIVTEDGSYTDECKVTVTKGIPNWLMVIVAPLRLIYNLILMILGK